MTQPSFLSERKHRSLERKFQKLDEQQAKEERRIREYGGTLPGHRNWVPATAPRSRVPSWLFPVVVVAAVLGTSYWLNGGGLEPGLAAQERGDGPPPGLESSPNPLGAPPAVTGEGGYEFIMTQENSDEPVAWDPCRPIHYVVYGEAPAGAEGVVREAVAEVSAATGLQFVEDGWSTESPRPSNRSDYQPSLYGERWAPLLIAWTTPEEVADLGGSVAGVAGPQPQRDEDGNLVYVSGNVNLDGPQLAEITALSGTAATRAVVLHEVGHAIGLDHYNDPGQIMFAEAGGTTELGDGDRRGLARLGTGVCAPSL